MTVQTDVAEFHKAFSLPVRDFPILSPAVVDSERRLRVDLLQEEWDEYVDAEEGDDIVAIADALADIIYVAYGTALTYGIDLDHILTLVHESNMDKLGPSRQPIYRDDGKVAKPDDWAPPDVAGGLAEQVVGAAETAGMVAATSTGELMSPMEVRDRLEHFAVLAAALEELDA